MILLSAILFVFHNVQCLLEYIYRSTINSEPMIRGLVLIVLLEAFLFWSKT